jgi:hypothetical protein
VCCCADYWFLCLCSFLCVCFCRSCHAVTAGLAGALAGMHDACARLGTSALRSLATCFGMVVGWGACGLEHASTLLRLDSDRVVEEVR